MRKRVEAIIVILAVLFCVAAPTYAKNSVGTTKNNEVELVGKTESLTPQTVGKGSEYVVIDNGVNIRYYAGLQSPSLGHLKYGEIVYCLGGATIYKDGYSWRHVQRVSDGTIGWVADCYLRKA